MSLLADLLLVLSLLFVRPVADRAWRLRLVLHALLLSACLAVAALAGGPAGWLCLAGSAAALVQAVLHGRLARRRIPAARIRPDPGGPGAAWLLAGLLLVALAVRLVPESALPAHPRGLLTVSIAILLTGLLAAVAAGSVTGRTAALLLAGDGLLLAACTLPGGTWLSLAGILLPQGGLLWLLVRPADPAMAEPAAGS